MQIAEFPVFFAIVNLHNVRILLNTPHATNASLLDRFEAAQSATENAVDAWSTENNVSIEPVSDCFVDEHRRKPESLCMNVKLARHIVCVVGRFCFDAEPLVGRLLHRCA